MKCVKCGMVLSDNVKFCTKCGTKLEMPVNVDGKKKEKKVKEKKIKEKKVKEKKVKEKNLQRERSGIGIMIAIVFVCVLLFFLIGGMIGYFLFN